MRVTTRAESGRAAIEAAGAECWIGTPERLGTLRAALENVTIACWLLATAAGAEDEVRALHGSRLEFFLGQSIDTTVRGFVYEAAGMSGGGARTGGVPDRAASRSVVSGGVVSGSVVSGGAAPGGVTPVPADVLAEGERIVRRIAARNEIPVRFLRADPGDAEAWLVDANVEIHALLEGR